MPEEDYCAEIRPWASFLDLRVLRFTITAHQFSGPGRARVAKAGVPAIRSGENLRD